MMVPAVDALVAMACVWPETKAEMLAAWSSKRLTSTPAGATLASSWSSMAPRVTATDLPVRSAKLLIDRLLLANTAWKNGA